MHPAGVARIVLRIGRVWGCGLARDPLGAPGERKDDEEHGKPCMPVYSLSLGRPIRRAYAVLPIGSIRERTPPFGPPPEPAKLVIR
jgi:hypothetical protein